MSVFFFQQNTAYEMRISDWSSDVCSSDLPAELYRGPEASFASLSDADLAELTRLLGSETSRAVGVRYPVVTQPGPGTARVKMTQIGSTSCRGRGCQVV